MCESVSKTVESGVHKPFLGLVLTEEIADLLASYGVLVVSVLLNSGVIADVVWLVDDELFEGHDHSVTRCVLVARCLVSERWLKCIS